MADRYLSEEAVIRALEAIPEGSWKHIRFTKAIRELPAADVKPVVHGEWTNHRTVEHDGEYYCSNCGFELETFVEGLFYIYCPNCGADMREAEQ